MSHEYLVTARQLVDLNVRRPRQVDLRKAISIAYYALFIRWLRNALTGLSGQGGANVKRLGDK